MRRILRMWLGMVFFAVFFAFIFLVAIKFRVSSGELWKETLADSRVYEQMNGQVVKWQDKMRKSLQEQTKGRTLPKEANAVMTQLLSLDKQLTAGRFQELVETNIDRVTDYLKGSDTKLLLYLPVKEWNLPIEKILPGSSSLSGKTTVENALTVLGMKQDQVVKTVEGIEQIKSGSKMLALVLLAMLVLMLGLITGHYFLGNGLADRVGGTAWLLMISGFMAKLVVIGAKKIFEIAAADSKQPMGPWVSEFGRSLVGQFFDLGGDLGLVVGSVGLVGIVWGVYIGGKTKTKNKKNISR